jgi:hypothetical protein
MYYIAKRLQKEGLTLNNKLLLENEQADELKEMIYKMLSIDAADRPSIDESVDYKFFALSHYELETRDEPRSVIDKLRRLRRNLSITMTRISLPTERTPSDASSSVLESIP